MRIRNLTILASAILLLATAPLVSASYPISSLWKADVDGDGRPEEFTYSLMEQSHGFTGTLTIRSATNKLLWFHQWQMRSRDLLDDLLIEEGNISVQRWVSSFFVGSLTYGARLERRKVAASDLQPNFIEFYAKQEGITPEHLRGMILSQKTNALFSYRATWREDLMELVFVPGLSKFIRYGQGEY